LQPYNQHAEHDQGYGALTRNTTGELNTIGGSNAATGVNALFLNEAGSVNTANGAEALDHNTIAFFNTAMGYQGLPRQHLTSRRHLGGKETRIWLVRDGPPDPTKVSANTAASDAKFLTRTPVSRGAWAACDGF